MENMNKPAIAKALSNTLRQRIVEIIAEKPSTVSEIITKTRSVQPKVSANLAVLSEAGLVDSVQVGRERIYRICPEGFEDVVNWFDLILHSNSENDSDEHDHSIYELNHARTCYDHLAGEVGVYFLEEMLKRKWIVMENPEKPTYKLTISGMEDLTSRGVSIPIRADSKRIFAYGCRDWTVKKLHLGGALGAAILKALEHLGYVERIKGSRIVLVKKDLSNFFE
ncbi:MAG: ArsR/SmtB family transcription factor [Thermoplasmata archaeon]